MTTARLGFSVWEEEDLPLALELWGDPEVTRYISANGYFSEEEISSRLQNEIRNEELFRVQYWPIFNMETAEHVGCCGLRPYDLDKKVYELGFHLRREHWGCGFGKEAAVAVINYAFDRLQASKLFAGHNPHNAVSGQLLTKLGFRYTHDEYYAPTGLNHPSYEFLREPC
ncbi:GNAT family N-acetyltransferase [Paenibacillus terreus]|uniref:GNAT family N-acetyltransferase n=2 Tax=Paenibacillus terreus TaxID=1387834 RepID=A0ABV5B6S3_9BACL